MALFAIADLHLSLQTDKPMSVFGEHWRHHHLKIEENWRQTVTDDDTVLIPGDISWAMRLEEAEEDFAFIDRLPGTKVLGRGNHDYYWHSHRKIVNALPKSLIPNDRQVYIEEDFVVASTKGWLCPGASLYKEGEDGKHYNLEAERLEMVLKKAVVLEKPIIVMLHFPPFNEKREESRFTQLLDQYKVKLCVFGHLHGIKDGSMYNEPWKKTELRLVAADFLDFKPLLIELNF